MTGTPVSVRALGARALGLAAPRLLVAGCVAPASAFDVGVELAPDAPGWEPDLSIEPRSTPVQFRWRDDDVETVPVRIQVLDTHRGWSIGLAGH